MKIGIITLHRVRNYGSALQAYALQEYIEKEHLGEAELIDYIYPNQYHKTKRKFKAWLRNLYCVKIRDEYFRKGWLKEIEFKKFYRSFFHLSSQRYETVDDIMSNPPDYDLYMTGSDQLWNPNTLKNDPVMYCEFAPTDKRRVSFGASFTIKELPERFVPSVRERLNKYSHIGVREHSSLEILRSLELNPNINYINTCDPTLLLDAKDYDKLSSQSKVIIEGDYVLVYTLKYAFKPEPALSSVINQVRKQLGMKLVIIDSHKVKLRNGDKIISGIGPCEYCWLFAHAKYVVASSFHGTMFAIINRLPFTIIGPHEGHEDCRTADVLKLLGLGDNYIPSNRADKKIDCNNPYTPEVEKKIHNFINDSTIFLEDSIKGKSTNE
jgi:hypothetical protein